MGVSYTHMTIGYGLLLATIQEVTARMFTTTIRSQPVYSRSRLSEFGTARESGRFNDTDSDNARDRDATFATWFRCLIGPPTYLYEATIPSFFFCAHAKWKARISCDSWTSTRIEVLGREGLVSP